MEIVRIRALSDNYIFLLHDPKTQTAAVVDPAQARPVLKQLASLGSQLVAILNTHHHFDHIGGNQDLLDSFPDAVVYGGVEDRGRIPKQQVFLQEGDRISFAGQEAEVFFVPGHTRAHIAYYFPSNDPTQPANLFCGDTLFAGGCGRLFEGTPSQMVNSLSKIRQLPDNTKIWCAHEYTEKNLQFAITVDGNNPQLQNRFVQVKTARQRNAATVPSLLGVEKQTNPFLRWDTPELQQAMKTQDPVQCFARLRGKKDQF